MELLVTISIIAILASMMLVAMGSAQEAAKADKTRSTIKKLNNVIMERWESYKTRRVPVVVPSSLTTTRQRARLRLDGLRALMRMELPDRFSDINDPPILPADPANPVSNMSIPSATLAYRRKVGTTPGAINERAECLYLIVMTNQTDDGDRAHFHPTEVRDTDGNGLMEFVDGWGKPIRFLRWAPGFVSEMQPAPVMNEPISPDPFDPMRVYPTNPGMGDANPQQNSPNRLQPFAIFPLIYSAGADGVHDLYGGPDDLQYATKQNDPYLAAPELGGTAPIGTPFDTDSDGRNGSLDNITNHSLGAK